MSVQRGLPHLFHFELVRGFARTDARSATNDTGAGEAKDAPDASGGAKVVQLRGEAQAVRVLYQHPPDEAS